MKEKEYLTPEIEVDNVDADVVTASGGWTPGRPLRPVDAESSMSGLLDD